MGIETYLTGRELAQIVRIQLKGVRQQLLTEEGLAFLHTLFHLFEHVERLECRQCHDRKPAQAFATDRHGKLRRTCKACLTASLDTPRVCRTCGVSKPLRAFHVAHDNLFRPDCKECHTTATRRWQQQNKDKVAASARRRRERVAAAHGSHTEAEWHALCMAFGNVCLACGGARPLVTDHVIPLSKGGDDTIANCQPLCATCNNRKGVRTIDYRDAERLAVFLATLGEGGAY